ncbi:probable 2-oxoglutarate dehydrogenase E1 component DHKTD1, mitochondrial [Trichonephila inaurata madagascariensis]|uniref:Probable 2-oxoglutarate dehydrogenase E1 component DHKTD1, mitochondrial n=1 Tax=Trichonephila inaurata madagascariensis TaxID=2747483 RepID=A0A8X7BSI5_9ARAC|nr:probable 2-oxoglutarate dehydrogenase E1 component DHKTD1, mitochondrial [Trichonephila inaurata madagascariensis]
MNRFINKLFKYHAIKYHSYSGVYGFRIQPTVDLNLGKSVSAAKYINNAYHITEAFRNHGYKIANLNPLAESTSVYLPHLDPLNYGLENNKTVSVDGFFHSNQTKITCEELLETLKKIYCNKIGVELQHLHENEKEWLTREFEKIQLECKISHEEKKDLVNELIKSEVFDNFLATKFATVKRYGGEGAESMIGFFLEIFRQSCLAGLKDVVIGIPHRGRLNLLTGLLNFPPVIMFKKMLGFPEFPSDIDATGDVLSHLTGLTEYKFKDSSVHITLLPNPSHLEAVSPVVVGYARSRLQTLKLADYETNSSKEVDYPVLPIQVHGDASFSGQGVVMETIAMSNVPHYSVGGSIHLIVNNQIGFTTPQERGRSSEHASDLMKMIGAPIIHVNGDHPEEVLKATRLAFSYRQKFKKDIMINLLCFRRWGHNELDDPTFTNPMMYKIIHSRKSVPNIYAEKLINGGEVTKEDVNEMSSTYYNTLNENLKLSQDHKTELSGMQKVWNKDLSLKDSVSVWDTGISMDVLKFIGFKSVQLPETFNIHPTLAKNFVQERLKKIEKGNQLDWASAEALAIGSVLFQGHNVRISGQDVGRGTFSHRHVMLVDQNCGEIYVPLNHMTEMQEAHLEVANSILSEEGVLGFEYGFNVENTNNLTIWEAQFGDFFNSAQVVFDTCISSGETKWLLPSNLVILLPHGYDGAGPEHSSCRLERFLQMCDSSENKIDTDDVNWHIANPTTPAQYFHLLRNQVVSKLLKPLIIVGPKVLLRHPSAISSLQEMIPGTNFKSVLEDNSVSAKNVKKIIFCSGKHFYLLQKEKESRNVNDCAIIRIEKLCPFPAEEIHRIIKNFKNVQNFVWSQEEHQNMGAWTFVESRFRNLLGCQLKYAGRRPLCTPAVGIGKLHQEEARFCKAKLDPCKSCKSKIHHYLLCERISSRGQSPTGWPGPNEATGYDSSLLRSKGTLLQTCNVIAYQEGETKIARVLLNNDSESCWITELRGYYETENIAERKIISFFFWLRQRSRENI